MLARCYNDQANQIRSWTVLEPSTLFAHNRNATFELINTVASLRVEGRDMETRICGEVRLPSDMSAVNGVLVIAVEDITEQDALAVRLYTWKREITPTCFSSSADGRLMIPFDEVCELPNTRDVTIVARLYRTGQESLMAGDLSSTVSYPIRPQVTDLVIELTRI